MITTSKASFILNRLTRRFLNLQEFQSKELMNKFGLVTQKFKIIKNVGEAEMAARELSTSHFTFKFTYHLCVFRRPRICNKSSNFSWWTWKRNLFKWIKRRSSINKRVHFKALLYLLII